MKTERNSGVISTVNNTEIWPIITVRTVGTKKTGKLSDSELTTPQNTIGVTLIRKHVSAGKDEFWILDENGDFGVIRLMRGEKRKKITRFIDNAQRSMGRLRSRGTPYRIHPAKTRTAWPTLLYFPSHVAECRENGTRKNLEIFWE